MRRETALAERGIRGLRLCSRGGEKRRSNGSSALYLAPNRRSISSRPPRRFGLLSFGTFQPICSRSPMQDMPKRCPQTQCQDIFARFIRALGADHTEVIATIVRRRCPVGQIDKHPSFRREYPIRNRRKQQGAAGMVGRFGAACYQTWPRKQKAPANAEAL